LNIIENILLLMFRLAYNINQKKFDSNSIRIRIKEIRFDPISNIPLKI